MRWILLASVVLTLAGVTPARAQTKCLTDDELKRIIAQANAPQRESFNQELQTKLLKLKEKSQKRFNETIAEKKSDEVLKKRMRESREKNSAELCPILKQYGWPSAALVGLDGVEAAFSILKNSASLDMQRQLMPVIVAATQRGEIDRGDFAGYVDRLRLSAGLKQLFGTQASIRDGFLVLYPIEAESLVDARRREFHLAPLSEYLRNLQRTYRMPLIRSPERPVLITANQSRQNNAGSDLLTEVTNDDVDVVRVDTSLVNLDVSVYNPKLRTHVTDLEQKDFKVIEDGHEETISFFSATHVPFDLVLVLDLSGSTQNKRDLIRKSTQHFIEAARPADRLAIVTFSDDINVVAPLTQDRAKLINSVQNIDGQGGSRVWDALKFTLDKVFGPKTTDRRRAVVFMTDGADNALSGWANVGSAISFADLLEAVRRTDVLIVPIYLDTEGGDPFSHRIYENARKTLARLAEESDGLYYKAKKIGDLNGVYEQVIDDLGKIYSLGYKPTNALHDGSWRAVNVQIVNRPELMPRVRPGYYAK